MTHRVCSGTFTLVAVAGWFVVQPMLVVATSVLGKTAEAREASAAGPAHDAPPPPRRAVAVRVDEAPRIDGRLDERAWLMAEPLTDFVQYEPVVGAPVSEPTEVRFLFDDQALYIGARLYDSEPERIIVGERRRNADLSQSDALIVVLDTFRDRQNGFIFGTNPGGIEHDGQVRGGGVVNTDWNGSWSVATSRDSLGWSVEMRIPFSTLRYGPGADQVWGLNMARYIGRKNEQGVWSRVPRQYNLYRLTEAGLLTGVQPPPGRVLTVTPYLLGGARNGLPDRNGTDRLVEVGADAKIGITPSLVLDLTVNTDFAQVEVDDQQVDLSRFNLFFPERRPFFLENADLFLAQSPRPGSSQTPVRMFHSRRIGVEAGKEIPIRAGARLSGRLGGTDTGIIYMQTEGVEAVQDPNTWVVGRVLREFHQRSRVGAIVTSRQSSEDSSDLNRTYGIDARLGIADEWTLDLLAGRTDTPGVDGDQTLLSLVGEYRDEHWLVSAFYDRVGDAFNPEAGFLRRSAYVERHGRVQRNLRFSSVDWLRELRPHTSHSVAHDLSGFKETERLHLHVPVELDNGVSGGLAMDWELNGFREPFRIAGTDIEVRPGTYSGWSAWSNFSTHSAAPVSVNGRVEVGSFLSGDRVAFRGGVSVQRGGTLTGDLSVNHNRIRLPEGDFNTTLTQMSLRFAFSPTIALQTSVQYSDQSGVWTGQVRFSWMETAGTGLFVVYNERRMMDVQGVQGVWPTSGDANPERSVLLKFTRQFDLSRAFTRRQVH